MTIYEKIDQPGTSLEKSCSSVGQQSIRRGTKVMASRFAEKQCPLCSFQASTMRIVLGHLRTVHSSDPRFNVVCGIDGCSRSYHTFSGFYSHIYRQHKTSGIIQRESGSQAAPGIDDTANGYIQSNADFQYDPETDMGECCNQHASNLRLKYMYIPIKIYAAARVPANLCT